MTGCSVRGSKETYRSLMIFAFLLHYYIFSLTFIHRVCSEKMENYSIYIFDEIISNRGYCEFSVLIIPAALVIFVFVYLFMIGAFVSLTHSKDKICIFTKWNNFFFNFTLTKWMEHFHFHQKNFCITPHSKVGQWVWWWLRNTFCKLKCQELSSFRSCMKNTSDLQVILDSFVTSVTHYVKFSQQFCRLFYFKTLILWNFWHRKFPFIYFLNRTILKMLCYNKSLQQ